MVRHRRAASLATVLATAAALLAMAPADAQELRVPDARHDYWHDHRWEGDPPDQHRPDWGNPDIRRTVHRHGPSKARVRIRIARLEPGDGGYWEVEARFRTDEGLRRKVVLFKSGESPAIVRWSGHRRCSIEHRVNYGRDVFVVAVPRRCLSFPKRVAFKSATRWWPTSDDVAYLDVTGTTGYRLRRWSAPVRRG